MNKNVEKLYQIAKKKNRIILGLMSGTSLDGLDMAVCAIENAGFETKINIQKFCTVPYEPAFKQAVRQIFSRRDADLQNITLMHARIAEVHAAIILNQLREWNVDPESIDLIASHGQSIFHAPKSLHGIAGFGNATLQIGDGDHLAVKTGIITISDFRQKHVAANGEGAPLAAYGDLLLFKEKDADVFLLNIGGISNFSFLPQNGKNTFSTDIGPGNTLMDAWMQKHGEKNFDEDAVVARQGTVNLPLLQALKQHPFFSLPFPKTTGPELFNLDFLYELQKKLSVTNISTEDMMCTLNRLTAETITEAINAYITPGNKHKLYVSGGGIHNPLLMEYLDAHLQTPVLSTSEKNIDPDAKEAVLFALLANEAVAGNGETFSNLGNNFPAISMGKISMPN